MRLRPPLIEDEKSCQPAEKKWMAEIPPGSLWANGLKLEEQKVEEKSRLGPEKVARLRVFAVKLGSVHFEL